MSQDHTHSVTSTPHARVDIESLREQQRVLRNQGSLHWYHWLIVALSFAITLLAWQTSRSTLDERAELRFEQEASRVVNQISERLKHYEDALLSGVAAMQAQGGAMTREQWRLYTDYLDLAGRYPGVSGIGVIEHVEAAERDAFLQRKRQENPEFALHPEHEFGFHLPITLIEPEADNAQALGLDVAFEYQRRSAAMLARSEGTTQISGPIVLVQDSGKTPGFLFYAPWFKHSPATAGDNDDTAPPVNDFQGFVYAPLVVNALIEGALGTDEQLVTLTLRDGATVLYGEADADAGWRAPLQSSRAVQLHGRTWTFDIASTPAFSINSSLNQPLAVLLSGLVVDLMLLILFYLMSRSNTRVLSLAETMTNNLCSQAQVLSASNRDLEEFAHVVSHDLKTPIRHIENLTMFLDEDLGEYLASDDAHPDIRTHLDGLHAQATRSRTLITGILDYSVVGAPAEACSPLDTRVFLESIREALQLQPEQLLIDADMPVVTTYATRLGQVLSNLIENAFKYNHDPEKAVVWVSAVELGDTYRFSVEDNGPGIDARFHDTIFKPFTKLDKASDVKGSGIGLAIVKRSVEAYGGHIEVQSTVGAGTTIHFTWPVFDVGVIHQQAA